MSVDFSQPGAAPTSGPSVNPENGGITAIMGASASGKSVLMKVLAGRLPKLHITGEVTIDGLPMDINDTGNSVNYVPQDDFLMGELTARETLRNNARMKRDTQAGVIDQEVDDLLRKFGLDHIADNAIGTVFRRGLSGGQRKRVEVCSELISPHSVLMLDEPTSGLDGAIAYEVLSATKKILKEKKGQLSVIISIHQPNSRILELFDHIMLIGGGGMIFFGTVPQSIRYFSNIGFPPPEEYTPTDVFLQMTNISGGLLWIVLMMSYIQVFKVYHLSRANIRFKHEVTNGTYDILAYWLAELAATAILLTTFIPGTVIAYFMMGLPSEAYPFLLFLFWLTALTTESMLNVITKFSENATVSIVTSQAILVILTVFGGGVFIAWDQCPDYWVWLQEISLITQASRAAIMAVNDHLTYSCAIGGSGQCIGPLGDVFPCDASPISNGYCEVDGRTVVNVLQGTIANETKWIPFEFVNQSDVQPLARGCALEWKNLSVILPGNGKKLINSVSGVAMPGRILALMGPSGAGKTTLLNALGNRAPYAKIVGEVTFGKRPFTAADLVYVPQFDEFNQNLTVYEQIEFVGAMKCQDKREMRRRLGHLLTILGLADQVHTSCKDLTSGELKRVSVGMGMISNPNVLFLDEPTTGLDSSAAYSIVKYLSELSRATNVVVIMTIHQPAQMVFDMLQDLYLLESGRLAFFGPLSTTRDYFAQMNYECPADVNPADFYLDMVNKPPVPEDTTITWTDKYYGSTLAKNVGHLIRVTTNASETAGSPPSPPSNVNRFLTLVQFFSRYYWRDIGFYWLRVGFLVVISIFMGTLFLQLDTETEKIPQYSGAIFFNIWTALFSAVAATGLLAADRRQAIEQVKNAVLTPSVYCLAQLIVSVPFNFTAAVIYQSIFHWLIDINPRGESFIYAILISCGHFMLMEAIMLTVVAVLKNAMLSVTFAMVVLGYLFLFSGFFIPVRDMPVSISWVPYVTPTRYSFDGYLWQVYSTQDFDVSGFPGAVVTGKTLLDNLYGITDVNSWGMFGVLLAWIALFRVTHYFFFYYDVRAYLRPPTASATEEGPTKV
eukprot:gene3037-2222_t